MAARRGQVFDPTLTERFHVLEGSVGFMIAENERVLGPGDRAEVPAGTVHNWWQLGDREAEVVVEVDPGGRFVEMVGTMFGLAGDGEVNARGLPHPLRRSPLGATAT
jgi:hypothetical protein